MSSEGERNCHPHLKILFHASSWSRDFIDEVERIELAVPDQDQEFTCVTATVGTGTVFEFVEQFVVVKPMKI